MTYRVTASLVFCLMLALPLRLAAGTSPPSEDETDRPVVDEQGESDDFSLDDPLSADLAPVTVQARRKAPDGRRFERVEATRIQESGAQSATDVLDLSVATSVGVNSRGEQKFTLRGFDQRQVLVLIDGLPFNAPYTGVTNVGRIPAQVLDSIELVKGSSLLRYGAQGLGGAVNLITRAPGKGPAFLATYETDGQLANRFGAVNSGNAGAFSWLAAAGFNQRTAFGLSEHFTPARNEDGGARTNSDSFDWHLIGKAGLELTQDHRLEGGVTYFQGEAGVPPHVSSRTPRYWRWSLWRSVNTHLTHMARWTPALRTDETLYALALSNTLDAYDNATYTTQLTPGAFTSTYYEYLAGGRFRTHWRLPSGRLEDIALRLVTGARYERHESEDGTRGRRPAIEQVYFQAAPELGIIWNWLVETRLGFAFDSMSPLGTGNSDGRTLLGWGPLALVALYPHRQVTIEAATTRQVRFPTLSERFGSEGKQREPNPDLTPEHAWNTTLDITYRPHRIVELRVGGYESEVRDQLEERFFGGGLSRIVNAESLRIAGVECELGLRLPYEIEIDTGYGFLHYWRLAGTDGPYLTYRPAHKALVRVYARPLRHLGFGTEARIVGPQYYQTDDSGQWGRLGTYGEWSARLDVFPTRHSKFWLRASNLLDMNYQPYHGQPAAGRQFFVGAEVRTE